MVRLYKDAGTPSNECSLSELSYAEPFKDVGSQLTCQWLDKSIDTLPWKVSHILWFGFDVTVEGCLSRSNKTYQKETLMYTDSV